MCGVNRDSVDTIVNSFATGTVSGATVVGGLVGSNMGLISNSSPPAFKECLCTNFEKLSDVSGIAWPEIFRQLQLLNCVEKIVL